MSIAEIEEAIKKLSPPDLAELAAWFADYQSQQWEKQMEQDLDAGRLDNFLDEVEQEYDRGQAKAL